MEKRVLISPFQKVTDVDMTDLGLYPEKSLDDVVFDTIIPDQGYSGFATIQSAPTQATVGNGRLYQAGAVYFNDTNGGQVIDFIASLSMPLVTNRIATIVAWGTSISSNVQPRTFLTNPVTRASVGNAIATEQWRWANLSVVNGVEGPDPVPPALATNVVAIANVTLSTSGIVLISPVTANLVPSVRGNSTMISAILAWQATAGSILSTLRSDLSSLAARINGLAQTSMVVGIAEDVARLKNLAGLPATYTAWDADEFMDTTNSDVSNVAYYANVEEGLRFPYASVAVAQLGLLNPIDPNVTSSGNFILPSYTPFTRIVQCSLSVSYTLFPPSPFPPKRPWFGGVVVIGDLQLNISNIPIQTISWILSARSRARWRYGFSYVQSLSSLWWPASDRYGYIWPYVFHRAPDPSPMWWDADPAGWQPLLPKFLFERNDGYWHDYYEDPQWALFTTTSGVSGSVVGETFLNSQEGYLIEIGLYFSSAGLTGDVQVALCQTVSGAPDPTNIVATATIPVASINLNGIRTAASFVPTLLTAGTRYAFIISTPGNHYLWVSAGNKYTDGTLFTSTDGAWFQGDLTQDICFDAVFAQFTAPQVAISLNPLSLSGGIVGIDINADLTTPNGTELTFQVQQSGVWQDLSADTELTGLPALLPLRATFNGTTQVMPGIGLATNSQATTNRVAPTFEHISLVRTLPSACSHIYVTLTIQSWTSGGSPAHDTIACVILSGSLYGTSTNPATVTTSIPIDDPTGLIVNYVFNMSPSVSTYKIEISGTIDNVVTPYVVSERVDVAVT